MNSRMRMVLMAGVCLVAVFSLVWATGPDEQATAPTANGNLKALSFNKVTPAQVSSNKAALSIQGEQTAFGAASTEPEPDYYFSSGRQGGDVFSSALQIPGYPYLDSGTTVGYNHDYADTCGSYPESSAPDVVYKFTPAESLFVTVALCQSSYYTRLTVYEDSTDMIACNRYNTYCATPRSAIENIEMYTGVTYYMVVSGDHSSSPNQGDYVLELTAEPMPEYTDSVRLHPTLADNGNGILGMGYDFNNGVDSAQFWFGSADDGASWPAGGSFTLAGWTKYPSLDYQGFDTMFFGTCVPHAAEANGARTCRLTMPNPPGGNWSLSTWGWESYGWHDMKMADIACDDSKTFPPPHDAEYCMGIISMVHSSTYEDGGQIVGDNSPHIFYEGDSSSSGWIGWLWELEGCNSTTIDIDKITGLSYQVFDWWNPDSSRWELVIWRNYFRDMNNATWDAALVYNLDSNEYAQNPAVAVHDGSIVIATEHTVGTDTSDHDIICWHDPEDTSGMSVLSISTIVATADDERYPRMSHVSGSTFVCTYVANNQLYMVISEDGGVSWGTPTVMSGSDHVVSEYRSHDIGEKGGKLIWEYQPGLPGDTSIFVHIDTTGLVMDSDGDGVNDDVDNCPLVFNPGQEDADGDTIGNACDTCTDTDGDGYGNPGYAANTCPDDNCPTIVNPGQEDADGDGIGDVCDDCTDTDGDGYGNPGYAANTCPDDNCPDTANVDQADTDSDGVGDACCCTVPGNADDEGTLVEVSDLTYVVSYLFQSGPAPPCPSQGDADGSGFVDVADLTYLVTYLFQGGPPPLPCP
ncbi:MAG: thrombospondin type 3 repeat-containing protein [bacterium]